MEWRNGVDDQIFRKGELSNAEFVISVTVLIRIRCSLRPRCRCRLRRPVWSRSCLCQMEGGWRPGIPSSNSKKEVRSSSFLSSNWSFDLHSTIHIRSWSENHTIMMSMSLLLWSAAAAASVPAAEAPAAAAPPTPAAIPVAMPAVPPVPAQAAQSKPGTSAVINCYKSAFRFMLTLVEL